MRKTISTILLSSLMTAAYTNVQAQETAELSQEQLQHEKLLTDLRKQREILEVKHAQAQLLSECMGMGIDCRDSNLSAIEKQTEEFPTDITNVPMDIQSFQMPDQSVLFSHSGSDDSSPKLEAIQNQSAKLTHAGNTDWAVVGDLVGGWKVAYIDASKVRLVKASDKSKVKTLILRW